MKEFVIQSAPDVKGCKLILRGSRDRNMMILQTIGYGCAALLAVVSALSGETTWTLIAAILFLTIGVFISVAYGRAAKMVYSGIKDKGSSEFVFSDKGVKAGARDIAYSDIARAWENRTHMAFRLKSGGVFSIQKPKGEEKAFREFLNGRLARRVEWILL